MMSEAILKQGKILLIDDEKANVRLLEIILHQAGFNNVYSTTDSRQSRALFCSFQPDVVLLDLAMPHMDGFAVMQQLQQEMIESPVPILVLTADAMNATKHKALKAGARDFLTKPLDEIEVLLRINNLLESRFHSVLLEARVRERTKEMEEAMIQLERSNRDLQDFTSIASHDLQEPLRIIQVFGDRLQTKHGEGLSKEAHDDLARMQNAAGRMRFLIQDLLTYSRVTTQARVPTLVDLPATIQAILTDLSVRLEETGGRVDVGDLPMVEADALGMRQLFQNLISNGLKFHRENEPPVVKIYMRSPPSEAASPGRALVHIIVEDNGIGFDEKFVNRIFAPFERLHSQNRYSGTGIGLAICRKIVERHGGTITAQSEPEKGSKFLIELPLQQPKLETPLERTGSATPLQVAYVKEPMHRY